MHVSNVEKILKTRGSLRLTTAVYQLKYPQPKIKSSFEPSTSHISPHKIINPILSLYETKSETHSITSDVYRGKRSTVDLSEIDIPEIFS